MLASLGQVVVAVELARLQSFDFCRMLQACSKKQKVLKCLSVLTMCKEPSRLARNPLFGVSDLERHKPVCTATEGGKRLAILDLRRRGLVHYIKQIQTR